MSLLGWATDTILEIISELGYPGVFMLMIVEGILTPIPSEIIIPFAGYLAAEGELSLLPVILVGTAGAALGNAVAYYIGYRVGRPLITKYGRYIMLGEKDVRLAERWFAKYGDVGILLGHSIPGVRSFISFPAGIGRMRVRNFVVFSTVGALIWTTVLAVAGYLLLGEWVRFAETVGNVDLYAVLITIAGVIGYFYWRRVRNDGRNAQP
ncbi:MAG: DedA family protein [Thermoplasmatota archaeon]|nr:DedA family protein [Candidatus Thermoplasmatota archaeon]